jgi:hypothetical protein
MRRGLEMMETDLAGKSPKVKTLQKWTMTVVMKSKVTMMKASTHNKRKERSRKGIQEESVPGCLSSLVWKRKWKADVRGNQILKIMVLCRTGRNSTAILIQETRAISLQGLFDERVPFAGVRTEGLSMEKETEYQDRSRVGVWLIIKLEVRFGTSF